MPFVVDLVPGQHVIRAVFTGPVSVQERARALDTVLQSAARGACHRLLVDLSAATLLDASASETLGHASRLACEPTIRGMRVAYVGEAAAAASVESMAALRGFFYQRFRSQAAALRWLCGERMLLRAA